MAQDSVLYVNHPAGIQFGGARLRRAKCRAQQRRAAPPFQKEAGSTESRPTLRQKYTQTRAGRLALLLGSAFGANFLLQVAQTRFHVRSHHVIHEQTKKAGERIPSELSLIYPGDLHGLTDSPQGNRACAPIFSM